MDLSVLDENVPYACLMTFWTMSLKGVFCLCLILTVVLILFIHLFIDLYHYLFIHSFVLELFLNLVFDLPEVGQFSLALNTPLWTAIVFIARCSFLALKTPAQHRLSPPPHSFSKVEIGKHTKFCSHQNVSQGLKYRSWRYVLSPHGNQCHWKESDKWSCKAQEDLKDKETRTHTFFCTFHVWLPFDTTYTFLVSWIFCNFLTTVACYLITVNLLPCVCLLRTKIR